VAGVAEGQWATYWFEEFDLKTSAEIIAAPPLSEHAPLAEVSPGQRAAL
jgi:hypothetical protein